MPRGGRHLPARCVERLIAADLILHAGDLVQLSVLDQLRSYGEVHAVHGNVDDAAVRTALPAAALVRAAGVTIALVHDGGSARGRLARLRERFPQADAGAFGH